MFDYNAIQQQVIDSIEGSGAVTADDFDIDEIMYELRDRGIESLDDLDADEFWSIVAANDVSTGTLHLNTAEDHEIAARIVPNMHGIRQHCVQDVLRDLAAVYDWQARYYGANGEDGKSDLGYVYTQRVECQLRRRALEVLGEER